MGVLVIAVAGSLAGSLLWLFWERGRTQDQWTMVAARLDMSIRGRSLTGWPRLSGRFGRVEIEVNVRSRGGQNQNLYTYYDVRHPPVGPAVTLTRQGVIRGAINRVLGGNDVLVGDPLFDDRVVIDSPDEAAVRDFLTPARRAVVEDLLAVFPMARITNDSIRLSHRGLEKNPDTIVDTITWLVDLATVFSDSATDISRST